MHPASRLTYLLTYVFLSNLGAKLPELLPCGYLVGDKQDITISLSSKYDKLTAF